MKRKKMMENQRQKNKNVKRQQQKIQKIQKKKLRTSWVIIMKVKDFKLLL